jgi:protein-tyrosine kinase
MSKFFNETLKARNATLFVNSPKQSVVEEQPKDALALTAQAADLGAFRLENCRKLEVPPADLVRRQFKGSISLSPAEESYRALRTRLLRLRAAQGLRSVVITSATQGEGKTLTSLNLALSCAQLQDMRVLLIDADIRSCGLSRFLGSPAGPGLSDVLAGKCEPGVAILATDLPNLYVMSSGSPAMPAAELLASSRWPELIGWCNESFKLIVVDSPPILNLSDVELIAAGCDGVLMVVRAQVTKRDVLRKSARQIDEKKLLGAIYNAAEGASRIYNYGYNYISE